MKTMSGFVESHSEQLNIVWASLLSLLFSTSYLYLLLCFLAARLMCLERQTSSALSLSRVCSQASSHFQTITFFSSKATIFFRIWSMQEVARRRLHWTCNYRAWVGFFSMQIVRTRFRPQILGHCFLYLIVSWPPTVWIRWYNFLPIMLLLVDLSLNNMDYRHSIT